MYTILCLIWGSTWLAIKLGLQDAPPIWSAGLRFTLAALIIVFINLIRKARYPDSLWEILRLAIPGIFMYALSYMFLYGAEVYIDSGLTAMLFASFPFFVAAFSIGMLKDEKLGRGGWTGLVVGFIGIVIVFYDSLTKSNLLSLGVFLAVLGSAASAYGTVYIRAYQREYDIGIMAAVQMGIAALITLVCAIVFESWGDYNITARSVGALFYLAVFGSVVAFLIYYWLLKKLKAIMVSQIAFITPVIAIILGYLVRNETFSAFTMAGSILIMVGVGLVLRR
nr:EamA family transporter [candidate division Zixibacteria bacterium]